MTHDMLLKSRIAKRPLTIPAGVNVTIAEGLITLKGGKGAQLEQIVPAMVNVVQEGQVLRVVPRDNSRAANASSGTVNALLKCKLRGLEKPYTLKLDLVGVGYRAQVQGNKLQLTLGFSHPVVFEPPIGVHIETPTQTEILIKGADKQQVTETAAKIRAMRKPEPYKGKGVRRSTSEDFKGEVIKIKETKKK
jgi:large subunit ribosomal protein L6